MRRLCSTLLTTIVVSFGVLSFSQAAHAADGTLTFTSSETTIAPGESVILSWESTGVIDLETSWGNWPATGPLDPSGSVSVQFDYPGTYYFGLDGFHEDDDEFIDAEVEITVTGDIVSLDVQCGTFTITNLLNISVVGFFGDFAGSDDFDDLFELDGGQSDTFATDRTSIDIYVWHELDGEELLEGIVITQNCDDNSDNGGNNGGNGGNGGSDTGSDNGSATGDGNASGHPTVAPAAGIADANVGASPLAAGIALLIGATIAARRLRTHN